MKNRKIEFNKCDECPFLRIEKHIGIDYYSCWLYPDQKALPIKGDKLPYCKLEKIIIIEKEEKN